MRHLVILFFLFSGLVSATQNLRSGGKLKPEQANMDIRHYTVALTVDPAQQSIDGYAEIDLKLEKASNVLLLDLTSVLSVKKIWVNGKEHAFTHSDHLIRITNDRPWDAGNTKIKVAYGGKPAVAQRPPWDGGFQWAKDSLGNPWIAVTCQGEGAQILFPCKDHPSDEPNEGADLIITVPKGLVVAGPGLLKKVTTKGKVSTYHWKTNYTINNYCIVFNIGKYKVVSKNYTTVNGNVVPMVFYVLEQHADKAPHHLELLERSCRVFEKYFGEYPWVKEKIGIAETPHLGMEHQSMNAYGNKFRYTKVGGDDFDWLMHHEFGHEWFANKVSNIDWAHMWIQEGITSFGDALYTREVEGEDAYLKRMQRTARASENKKPIVLGEEVDSDESYHSDIYGKASVFMHTLRYVLGDSVFFPILKKLATDPKYTYDHFVRTDDVENLFSHESGKNLKPLFDFYLRTIKKLDVLVRQTSDDQYLVQLANFDMPLPMEIATDKGIERNMIDKKGIVIKSSTVPQPDPKGYYLKRVILE